MVCAMYPDADSPRPNTCNPPGMDTYLSARNSDVQVEFTIKVPPGVRLTGSTLRGAIQAIALTGEVNVSTNDGAISLSTTEGAQATTLRGSISATVGNVAWSGFRVFETLDGDVDLQIPIDANVSVRAATLRGSVTSDFPLTTRSGPFGGPTIASGTLGNDGRSLRLSTENGNIILRQGAATNH